MAGHRLLNDDASWAEVVSVSVVEEPLLAYNLTVEGFHTYFVAGDAEAAPVWVHNKCGPKLDKYVSERHITKADEIRSTPGGAVGNTFDMDNGGRVYVEGSPANYHELDLAVEIASETGSDVVVRGKTALNGDFDIDGVRFEIKAQTAPTATSAQNLIESAIAQADNVIIDGRQIGTSMGTAVGALNRYVAGPSFDAAKAVTMYTTGGRVRYIPGKGMVRD